MVYFILMLEIWDLFLDYNQITGLSSKPNTTYIPLQLINQNRIPTYLSRNLQFNSLVHIIYSWLKK